MTTAPKPATPLQVQELTSIRLEADRAKASAALTVALQQNTALLAERAELIRTIQTLVNLTSHPYFPPIKDLPAWDLNVMALRVFLAQTRDEQRIGGDK